MSTKERTAKEIAREISNWLQIACSDMAYEHVEHQNLFDDDLKKKLAKAKKSGVRDLGGWYADELYNDTDLIMDLVGDRVCDDCGYETPLFYETLEELGKNAHIAQRKAISKLLDRHPRKT